MLYLGGITCNSCLEGRDTDDIATIPSDLVFRMYSSGKDAVGITDIYIHIVQWLGFLKVTCVELEDMPTCDAISESRLGTYRVEIALSAHSFGVSIYGVVGKHTFALIVGMGYASCYIEIGTTILKAQLTKDMGALGAGLVVVLVFVSYPKA